MQQRIRAMLPRERDAIGARWLTQFPIDRYVQWFRSSTTEGNYAHFPGELEPWFAAIAQEAGPTILSAYHRHALLQLMADGLDRVAKGQVVLAATVREVLREWLTGLLDRLEAEPGLHLDAHDDLFKKDISICALRMLPTRGPCHLEVGWLGRQFLVKGGIGQTLAALRCYLVDLHLDLKQLYTVHVEDRVVYRSFLEEGWQRTYEDVAAQMRLRPEIRALHAASWFWDPCVKEISPKMAYLQDVPRRGGARFFKLDTDETALKNSLTNPKRRRLFEAGEYVPTNYLMIWPRAQLLSAL